MTMTILHLILGERLNETESHYTRTSDILAILKRALRTSRISDDIHSVVDVLTVLIMY